MKLPPALLALLKQFAPGSLGAVAVVLLVLALVAPAAVFLYKWWKARKVRSRPGPDVNRGAPLLPPAIESNVLRRAWLKFFDQLPAIYRRSILNFQHFVVLGFAGEGKSRMIDGYSDWRRQTKQVPGSHSEDPDLQVYFGSAAVVMEVPSRIVADASAGARTALFRLFRRLYKRRAPTVVVVVDAVQLQKMAPEVIVDRAETLRSKINVLTEVRGRAVDVRVVLTHLDELEGFNAYATFCRAEGISMRIPVARGTAPASMGAQFAQWVDGRRAQIPRALASTSASAFREVVTFLQGASLLVPSVGQYLDALFVSEALLPPPVCDGVYLAAEPACAPSPLSGARDVGPGPNPRLRHLVAAFGGAAALSSFFLLAYLEQRATWAPAARALEDYASSPYGTESERRRRETICEFTYRTQGWLHRHPDFFEGARSRMRAKMSQMLRDTVLIPNLRVVAQRGRLREGTPMLGWRRSLYYLAVIHSDSHDGDRQDGMRITDPAPLETWSEMTGLSPDVIVDYIRNTDVAWRTPVSFDLGEKSADPRDTTAYWVALLRQLDQTMASGVVEGKQLEELHTRVAGGLDAIDRFVHDERTRKILDGLDGAGGATRGAGEIDLAVSYKPKFSEFLGDASTAQIAAQQDRLRSVLRAVRGSRLEVVDAQNLKRLVERLGLLYAVASPTGAPGERVDLELGGKVFAFDVFKWRELLRDSEAAEQIARFARARDGAAQSIFFDQGQGDELMPVAWNATNDGSALFTGKATIERRNTVAAYDKYVRDPVKKLSELLEKARVPDDLKRQLRNHVREHVRHYSREYRHDLVHYYQSFGLRASSEEALRVALTQMVRDVSPFADFLATVDKNSRVTVDDPMLEPMQEVLSDWSSFHNVVDPGGGAPELVKYRAILQQLLAELGVETAGAVASGSVVSASDAGAPSSGGALEGEGTLERALSPSGRLVLANMRGDKGAYAAMVHEWMASIALPEWQRPPFAGPFDQLQAMGKADLERVLARVWERDMRPDLQQLAERFPFSAEATEEASPREITALLHPQTGRFFDLFRRYLEPISEVEGGLFRERRTIRGRLSVPRNMYPMTNAAAALSSRLWDAAGKPIALAVRVATVPFDHGPDPRSALTLVYLNVGEVSVFNFNQKPVVTTVTTDWTKEHNAQVGVQFTDLDTKENSFPEPMVVEGSHWSLLRLLRRSQVAPVKQPPNATLHTWEFKVHKSGPDKVRARFVAVTDPWEMFAFAKVLRSAPGAR